MTGTSAKVTVTTLRDGNNNYFYEPASGDMIVHPATLPSVIVKVNGIESFCDSSSGCSYETDSQFNSLITSATYDESTLLLSMGVSISSLITFDKDELTITFGGVNCNPEDSSTSTLIKCTLEG